MEAFDLYVFVSGLSYLQIIILLLVALFASIVSGISGYGGGLTLGILVSPFIPVKLLSLSCLFLFSVPIYQECIITETIFFGKRVCILLS